MTKSIMLVGVGGQGTLLASRVLGTLLTNKGFDVKVSEVHGMAQRGGSVVTYVRYGEKVYSPVVDLGTADMIVSFERLDALRYALYAKKDGVIIYNDQRINPMPVITGAAEYPEGIYEQICAVVPNTTRVDALALANEAGSAKAVNIALLGLLAKRSEFEKEDWIEAVRACVPEKFLELNLKAFELGYNL